jgi:hypothetical protein
LSQLRIQCEAQPPDLKRSGDSDRISSGKSASLKTKWLTLKVQ